MIYTIGHEITYWNHFKDQGKPIKKVGKGKIDNKPYPGGSVFKTEKDARDYLKRDEFFHDYAVFGVLADWEKDTEPSLDKSFHNLLTTSEIVMLTDGPGGGRLGK